MAKFKIRDLKDCRVEGGGYYAEFEKTLLKQGYIYIYELMLLDDGEVLTLFNDQDVADRFINKFKLVKSLFLKQLPTIKEIYDNCLNIKDFMFLSSKAKNLLFFNGVNKLSDLCNFSLTDVKNLKNIEPQTINEIYVVVQSYKKLKALFQQNEQTNPFDCPIDSLSNLSYRAKNQLTLAGYKTLRELEQKSLKDICKIKNIGKKTAEEIHAIVSDFIKQGFGVGPSKKELWLNDVCQNGLYVLVGDEFVNPRDCSITRVYSNKRLIHQLHDENINTIYELLSNYDKLESLITTKTFKELSETTDKFYDSQKYCCDKKTENDYKDFYNKYFGLLEKYFSHNEINYLIEQNNKNSSLLPLLENTKATEKFKSVIITLICSFGDAASFDEISSYFFSMGRGSDRCP